MGSRVKTGSLFLGPGVFIRDSVLADWDFPLCSGRRLEYFISHIRAKAGFNQLRFKESQKKSPHHITFYPLEKPLSVTQASNWPLHHVLSPSARPCFATTSHSLRRKVKRHKGRVITAFACWKGTQRKHEVWAALKTPSGARIH